MAKNTFIQDPNTPKYDTTSGLLTDYGRSLGLKEVNGQNKNSTLISTDALNTPGTPLKINNTGYNPTTLSDMESSVNSVVTQAKTNKDSALNALMEKINQTGTLSSSVDRTAQDEAGKRVDKYTSQIEAEQLANRRAIEKLQKNNPDGLGVGALNSKLRDLERESLSKQADIAILESAANRDYERAASIADRQLQLKMEQNNAELSMLKLFYEDNKDYFNTQEKRQYDEMIKVKDREYNKKQEEEQTIRDLKLTAAKNGAGLDVLNKLSTAKTMDEALKIASKYTTDPLDRALKQAQLKKIYADINAPSSEELKAQKDQLEKEEKKKAQVPIVKEKINLLQNIIDHKGMNSRVGPNGLLPNRKFLSIGDSFGVGQDFAASVQQLTNQDTLDQLLELKAAGGTLGAVSEKELDLLQKAASKINAWENKDKNGMGKGTWNVSEKLFKDEVNKMLKSTQVLYEQLGGQGAEQEAIDGYLNIVDNALQSSESIYLNSGYEL